VDTFRANCGNTGDVVLWIKAARLCGLSRLMNRSEAFAIRCRLEFRANTHSPKSQRNGTYQTWPSSSSSRLQSAMIRISSIAWPIDIWLSTTITPATVSPAAIRS